MATSLYANEGEMAHLWTISPQNLTLSSRLPVACRGCRVPSLKTV